MRRTQESLGTENFPMEKAESFTARLCAAAATAPSPALRAPSPVWRGRLSKKKYSPLAPIGGEGQGVRGRSSRLRITRVRGFWLTGAGFKYLWTVLVFIVTCLAPIPATAQTESQILSRELVQGHWGFHDLAEIRMGQVGVIHGKTQEQLEVYSLSHTLLPKLSPHVRSQTPSFTGNCFLVAQFDSGNTNRLGGYFNVFERPPSSAQAALLGGADGRRALSLKYDKASLGFCGLWIHLFDFKLSPQNRQYFNAEPFLFLTFWIRGRQRDEKILLKISDAQWERKEDALSVGEIGSFLPAGKIDRSWQQAIVPLGNLPPPINRHELAALVFETAAPGRSQVDVKNLGFCLRREPLPSLPLPSAGLSETHQLHKAIWVWNTSQILSSLQERQRLIQFLVQQGFDHVFLQLPNEPEHLGPIGEIQLDAGKLRPFLEALSQHGIKVHALDGFKNYALPEWHPRVLKTVENIIRYNTTSQQSERFYGIHYDIEPYLLPGFKGARREQILKNYLELLRQMASQAHRSNLVIGVDIPFWYDAPDEFTYQLNKVDFDGNGKPAGEHVIDLMDYIAIMDYRTSAYGADGTIAQAVGELAYASQKGKQVFIGLETSELPDEDLLEFQGEPSAGLPQNPPAGPLVFVAPQAEAPRLYVVPSHQLATFERLVRQNGTDLKALLYWPVTKTISVPGNKLSFAKLGANLLFEAMDQAKHEMMAFPSFVGFAIHHYESYRELLNR